jgi:hypothetical protein
MDQHYPEHQGFAIPLDKQSGHPSLDLVFEKHPNLLQYFDSLPSFMIVRNPYDRATSAKRHHLRGDHYSLDRNIYDITKYLMKPGVMHCQKEYQYFGNKKIVQYVFKFEQLFGGDKIINFEDITIDLSDIWQNKNTNFELLTDRDRMTIDDICHCDFIEYGYDKQW